jgi:hypothetical protein
MGNEARGRNGQVAFDGRAITIRREGFVARSVHGANEKTIPLQHVSAVQFKPASPLTLGFIQFSIPGEQSKSRRGNRSIKAAGRDENAVVFTAKQQPDFDTLRSEIERALIGT